MADISFSGNTSGNSLAIGGIAGSLTHYKCNVHVKNCVNYGSITNLGIVNGNWCAFIGGIVGHSDGTLSLYSSYIQNCLNYGPITHNGTAHDLYIGGTVSYGKYMYIENCVSAGKISTLTTASGDIYIGSIVGKIGIIYINYCYFTSDVNASRVNGTGTPSSTTGTPDTATDVESELLGKLNSNATSCNWSNWFMLHLNGGSINNLAQELLVEIQGHIPEPVKERYNFMFWCKDAECAEEFDPETEPVDGITDLYAAWTPDNYTVIFDANGGNISETSKIVAFNEEYGDLPVPNKTGYMFVGWFNEGDDLITNETIVTTPDNHTLYAHWEEVTTQVEIVFNRKELTEDEIKKLIDQYAKEYIEIIKYEDESGEIRAIIKFTDKENAEEFVRDIKKSDEAMNLIKRIAFVQDSCDSVSTMIYPLSFLSALFL